MRMMKYILSHVHGELQPNVTNDKEEVLEKQRLGKFGPLMNTNGKFKLQ